MADRRTALVALGTQGLSDPEFPGLKSLAWRTRSTEQSSKPSVLANWKSRFPRKTFGRLALASVPGRRTQSYTSTAVAIPAATRSCSTKSHRIGSGVFARSATAIEASHDTHACPHTTQQNSRAVDAMTDEELHWLSEANQRSKELLARAAKRPGSGEGVTGICRMMPAVPPDGEDTQPESAGVEEERQ